MVSFVWACLTVYVAVFVTDVPHSSRSITASLISTNETKTHLKENKAIGESVDTTSFNYYSAISDAVN